MSTKNNSRHHDNWVSTSSSKRRNVCSDRKKLIPHSLTFRIMYVPPFSVLCTTYHYPIKVLFGENIHFDDNPNKLITATNMIYSIVLECCHMFWKILITNILSIAIYYPITILRGVRVMMRKVIRNFLYFNAVCL